MCWAAARFEHVQVNEYMKLSASSNELSLQAEKLLYVYIEWKLS